MAHEEIPTLNKQQTATAAAATAYATDVYNGLLGTAWSRAYDAAKAAGSRQIRRDADAAAAAFHADPTRDAAATAATVAWSKSTNATRDYNGRPDYAAATAAANAAYTATIDAAADAAAAASAAEQADYDADAAAARDDHDWLTDDVNRDDASTTHYDQTGFPLSTAQAAQATAAAAAESDRTYEAAIAAADAAAVDYRRDPSGANADRVQKTIAALKAATDASETAHATADEAARARDARQQQVQREALRNGAIATQAAAENYADWKARLTDAYEAEHTDASQQIAYARYTATQRELARREAAQNAHPSPHTRQSYLIAKKVADAAAAAYQTQISGAYKTSDPITPYDAAAIAYTQADPTTIDRQQAAYNHLRKTYPSIGAATAAQISGAIDAAADEAADADDDYSHPAPGTTPAEAAQAAFEAYADRHGDIAFADRAAETAAIAAGATPAEAARLADWLIETQTTNAPLTATQAETAARAEEAAETAALQAAHPAIRAAYYGAIANGQNDDAARDEAASIVLTAYDHDNTDRLIETDRLNETINAAIDNDATDYYTEEAIDAYNAAREHGADDDAARSAAYEAAATAGAPHDEARAYAILAAENYDDLEHDDDDDDETDPDDRPISAAQEARDQKTRDARLAYDRAYAEQAAAREAAAADAETARIYDDADALALRAQAAVYPAQKERTIARRQRERAETATTINPSRDPETRYQRREEALRAQATVDAADTAAARAAAYAAYTARAAELAYNPDAGTTRTGAPYTIAYPYEAAEAAATAAFQAAYAYDHKPATAYAATAHAIFTYQQEANNADADTAADFATDYLEQKDAIPDDRAGQQERAEAAAAYRQTLRDRQRRKAGQYLPGTYIG